MVIQPRSSLQRWVLAICLLIANWTTSACGDVKEPPRRRITLRVLGPDGLAEALAERMKLPGVDIVAGDANIRMLSTRAVQLGEADIALAPADETYYGFVGELDPQAGALDRLRGIAVVQPIPFVLAVGARSGIHRVSDLRGHSVSLGRLGSSTALTAKLVLEAFGIALDALQVEWLGSPEASSKLERGALDAAFFFSPLEGIERLTKSDVGLIELSGPQIDRLLRDRPFLRATVIPRRVYSDGPIMTLGADSLLICRSDLDEELVYSFTRAFFDLLPTLSSDQPWVRFMDGELASATPIPLHAGAARYYREREMSR